MPQTVQESNYQYFMQVDISKYIGEWIVTYNNNVIANGKDLKEVAKKAKDISGGGNFY